METNISNRSGCSDGPYYRVCGPDLRSLSSRSSALIMEKVTKKQPAPAAAPAAAAPAAAPAPAVSAQNNQQIVAAIAVAIAEEMGTDVSHIRIHSIKRV